MLNHLGCVAKLRKKTNKNQILKSFATLFYCYFPFNFNRMTYKDSENQCHVDTLSK